MDENVKPVRLCGTQGCCPEVLKEATQVTITDDNGGRVQLTPEQWEILRQKMSTNEL